MLPVRNYAIRVLLAAFGLALVAPRPVKAEPWTALEVAAYLEKRLHLSREQVRDLRPAVDAYASSVSSSIGSRQGEGPEGWSRLLDELEEHHRAFTAELSRVLTPDQLAEVDALRAEVKAGAAARLEEQAFAGLQERLGLSEEVRQEVLSIFQEDWRRKRELVEKYREKEREARTRAVGKELAAIHEDTEAKLARVLTPEQMAEYHAYREEQRRKILELQRERRRTRSQR
jgi:hypothetical protein